MLSRCIADRVKKIDGIEFVRVVVVARVENWETKANKLLLVLNDNSDVVNVVKTQTEKDDEIEVNSYYELILSAKEEQ